jgi:hypothetical protein
MRIEGIRADGATLVLLDGGLACLVRGGVASPAVELSEATTYGPWQPADSSLAARRAMEAHLQRTRTVPLASFGRVLTLQDPPAAPVADAATLKAASAEHQTAATNEELDIDAMQDEADTLAEEALKMSEEAETAEEHRAASEALEEAAAAQEAIEKLQQPAVPEMGTPEFDAYIEQEVARRVAEAGAAPAPAPAEVSGVITARADRK